MHTQVGLYIINWKNISNGKLQQIFLLEIKFFVLNA